MWIPIVLALLLTATLVVAVVRVVRRDGLGHRPPPASHQDGTSEWSLR